MEGLKDYLKSLPARGLKVSLRTKADYMDFLKGKYGEETDISHMAYMFMNDMDTPPSAPCGEMCKFENVSTGYAEFCSKPKFGQNKCKECSDLVQNKKRETNIEKYGCENPAQSKEVRAKMNATNMERYGTTKPQQLDSVKRKTIDTNIEKYGVEHSSKLDENKAKREATVMAKYGTCNVLNTGKVSLEERYIKFKSKTEKSGEYRLLSSKEDYATTGINGIFEWEHVKCGRVINKVASCLRCPSCNPYNSSYEELEIRKFIESIIPTGTEVKYNSRSVIAGREIDIFIPSMNIGIEYNGDYWHSSSVVDSDYHSTKCDMMNKAGFKLISVFSSSWLSRQDVIKDFISRELGIEVDDKVYTVECIGQTEATDFLDSVHFKESSSKGQYHYGMRDESKKLVSAFSIVMKPNDIFEIMRFYGNSEQLNALMDKFVHDVEPKTVVHNADRCWNQQRIYESVGFVNEETLPPSFFLFDARNEIIHGSHVYHKSKIIDILKNNNKFTEEISSMQVGDIIKTVGWHKVYDCGYLKMVKRY